MTHREQILGLEMGALKALLALFAQLAERDLVGGALGGQR